MSKRSGRVGATYKQLSPGQLDGPWDAIVIGSGVGGLACAALLAKHGGQRVLVLERHSTAGGFTHTFTRPRLRVGRRRALPRSARGGLARAHALRRDHHGGDRVGAHARRLRSRGASERQLRSRRGRSSLRGRRDIERYLATVLASTRGGTPFFVDRALPERVSMLLGPALRAPLRRWSDRTAEDVIRPIVADGPLYDELTAQCGDYGLTPRHASFAIHAMVVGHYLRGAYYPVGGSRVIADRIVPTIEDAGGQVIVAAEVERVLVAGGRAVGVRMVDGRELRAPIVGSDAGAPNTYLRLLAPEIAEPTGIPARLREVGPRSTSASTAPIVSSASTARTSGSTRRPTASARSPASSTIRARPSRSSTRRSAKDPSFGARHPGKSTVELVTIARLGWLERWKDERWKKRGGEYEAWKAAMSERLLEILYRDRPSLRGHVAYAELSTRLSTRHFTAHPDGEIYGLSHTPSRFRLALRARTPVPGLFLTGQDLVSCGVAGALFGGALTAAAVLRGRLVTSLARRAFRRGSAAQGRAPASARGRADGVPVSLS